MSIPSLQVLLIGGSTSDAQTMCELLCVSRAIHFSMEWAESFATGITRLQKDDIDVVILHLRSTNQETVSTVQQIRDAKPTIPVVVLSEVADEELAFKAVKTGAQDYLVKGEFDLSLIERALRYAVERQQTQNALAVQQAKLDDSEITIREQTQVLQSILHNLSDGVVVANKEGKFLLFNPAAERMVGKGEADVTPNNWSQHYQLYLSDKITPFPQHKLPLVRAMRGENFMDEEVIARHPDGKMITLSVNGTPLTGPQGQINGGIVVFRDMTESKSANREIRRLNAELEQRVQERTHELATMNNELETFCYSVSHDLRRPLRHLDGYSLTLLEEYREVLDEQGVEFLTNVRAAAQQMGELIDALLDMSRTSRSQIQRKRFNLSKIVQRLAEELEQRHPQRQIRFTIPDGMVVKGDPDLLTAVMANLIDNAWKFTSHTNNAQIQFGNLQQSGQNIYYLKDNGIGFDTKFAANLFKPFQRLHNVQDFDGHGIGLATVERIISRHGGQVWAESRPNEGATFYFTLGDQDAAPKHNET